MKEVVISLIMRSIFFQFFWWYFVEMPKEILKAWKNFLKYNLEFFSIITLLKTFFAPWRQYAWDYGRGFDIVKYAEAFFSNMITRVLGAVVRSIVLAIGLAVEALIFVMGAIIFAGWLLLPFLIFIGMGFGFSLSFS